MVCVRMRAARYARVVQCVCGAAWRAERVRELKSLAPAENTLAASEMKSQDWECKKRHDGWTWRHGVGWTVHGKTWERWKWDSGGTSGHGADWWGNGENPEMASECWERSRRAETRRDLTRHGRTEQFRSRVEMCTPSPSSRGSGARRKAPTGIQAKAAETGAADVSEAHGEEDWSSADNADVNEVLAEARRARWAGLETRGYATDGRSEKGRGKAKRLDAGTSTDGRPLANKTPLANKSGKKRKSYACGAGRHACAASGGVAQRRKVVEEEKEKQSIADEHAGRSGDARELRSARGNEQSAPPTIRGALETLALEDDNDIQAEFWASLLAHIYQFAPHDVDLQPEIKKMREGDVRGSGHYHDWLRMRVREAPTETKRAFHGADWDALASIKNGVRPGPRQGGRRRKSWMNRAATEEPKVAFASTMFCEALKYAGPIAVRSCFAIANVMIVLGVYQAADECQVSGCQGDSKHVLQALKWHVSDVYVRTWVGTHAEDIGPSGCEEAGRFNWDETHAYREIIDLQNDILAHRLKAELANRIAREEQPMGSKLFLANSLRARGPSPDENDVAATTRASSATRQAAAAHPA